MSENDKPMPGVFFAKLFNVTDRYIRKLAQDGHIPKLGQDQYPMIGTIKAYVSFLQQRTSNNNKSPETLIDERTRLTHHQANIAAMDEEIKRGSLVPAEIIEKTLDDVFAAFRARVLSMPTKLAYQLTAISDIPSIEQILRIHIEEALIELSTFGTTMRTIDRNNSEELQADSTTAEA